jgi:hypothetical protein
MVDATIDLELSQNMYEVFNNLSIQELITTGRLNVVFLRSAQKMDMFGMDNYYGGITITVNNRDKSYKNFNNRMEHPSDQLNGLSYKGMTHLQKYSKNVRDSYRTVIMKNASYLFNKLPHQMIAHPGNFNPIQVSLKNDDKLVYLDIKSQIGGHHFEDVLQATLLQFGTKKKLLLTIRPSFGFYNMNITSLPNKFRICPGLEEVSQFNPYLELINFWQCCVNHTMKNCWHDKMNDEERVQMIKNVITHNFLEKYINNSHTQQK